MYVGTYVCTKVQCTQHAVGGHYELITKLRYSSHIVDSRSVVRFLNLVKHVLFLFLNGYT